MAWKKQLSCRADSYFDSANSPAASASYPGRAVDSTHRTSRTLMC